MAYTKQTWQDLPSKTTPINASRLGHIEQGIYDAASTADTAASDASSAISGLADKVDKVEGKGLSTNDFTDALKTKLDNIETGAEVNVQSDWNQSDNSADDYIKNKPSLGTSAYKNSTSVVTDSTDLVESGAVFDVVKGSVGFVASRNLAPITLDILKTENTGGTWNGNAYTYNGVTYTVNDDLSISMSGVASGNSAFVLLPTTPIAFLDAGNYFMSGCPSGGSLEAYALNYAPRPSGSHRQDIGDGLLINNTTANQGYNIYFVAFSGADMTGKVLKVQLEKGTSATPYYPYHESVEEYCASKELLEDTVGWKSNNKFDGGDVTLNKSDISSSFTRTLNGGFVENEKYKLKLNISAISGFELATTLRVQIYKTGSTSTKILPIYQIPQTVGIKEIEFSAGSTQADTTIQLYIQSSETGESATVTFTDISVTHVSVNKQKCDNSVIGTVEDGATVQKSGGYAVGSHAIRNGAFITWKNAKAQGETINDASDYTSGAVGDFVTIKYFYGQKTVGANSYLNLNIPTITGYTPVHVTPCMQGAGVSNTGYSKVVYSPTDGTIYSVLFNNTDSANHPWIIAVYVTYVKDIVTVNVE